MLLKFNEVRRVDKHRILDFEEYFYDSQNNKENTQIVELKFRAVIKIIEKDPATGEQIGEPKIHTIEKFIEAQTVYGGDEGLKLYIKHKTVQFVNMLEDSGTYIKNIALDNNCVSRRNQNVPVTIRQITIYGTLCNFKGYGLDTNNYDGACVLIYLLETYNNQDVNNPRNKISKLNMPKLLEILGM